MDYDEWYGAKVFVRAIWQTRDPLWAKLYYSGRVLTTFLKRTLALPPKTD